MIKVFEKLGKIENIKPEEFYRAVLEADGNNKRIFLA
jgi:hypothetical protein